MSFYRHAKPSTLTEFTHSCGHVGIAYVCSLTEKDQRARAEGSVCKDCRTARNEAAAATILADMSAMTLPEIDARAARARNVAIAAVRTMCECGTGSEFFPINPLPAWRHMIAMTNPRTWETWLRSAEDAGYKYITYARIHLSRQQDGSDREWDDMLAKMPRAEA